MRQENRRRGASGFSLIEMLIVVVMIGIMSLFAFPRVAQVYDQSQVRGARQAVLNKFNTARMNARQSGRSTFLVRNGTYFWIERSPRVTDLLGSTRDTVGGYLHLRASWGVEVTGFTEIPIDPRGLVQLAPHTLSLTRNTTTDAISITGFGIIGR